MKGKRNDGNDAGRAAPGSLDPKTNAPNCTGEMPKCSICPVLEMCKQIGVGAHR